jgi:hypothetical protein
MNMKAYKGFNKDMTCSGFQFEEGETYHEDKAELCKSGFHACELPLDCIRYYGAANSEYHEVELNDVDDARHSDDSKVCGKTIKIGAKIGIPELVQAHIKMINNLVRRSNSGNSVSGDRGNSVSGDSGNSVSGDRGNSVSGDRGNSVSRGSASVGKNGLAVVRGKNLRVKGGLGAILFVAEENEDSYEIKEWKAAIVDGEKIKADTWYTLKDGEFVEVKE